MAKGLGRLLRLLALLLLLLPRVAEANMASPRPRLRLSSLYGSKDCSVTSEEIRLAIRRAAEGGLLAEFQVDYRIHAPRAGEIPLVFVGEGLSRKGRVLLNGGELADVRWGCESRRELQYAYEDSDELFPEDLVYFRAPLREGANRVSVSYTATPANYSRAFLPRYRLLYKLYPSRFWKHFGTITLRLSISEDYELDEIPAVTSRPEQGGTVYKLLEPTEEHSSPAGRELVYEIDSPHPYELELQLVQRVRGVAAILIWLTPFGLAAIALLLLSGLHLLLLREAYRTGTRGLRRRVFWLGGLLVPVAFYGAFLLAFPLLDLLVDDSSDHFGYYYLFPLTWPILQLAYLILMGLVGRFVLRRRYAG